MRYKIKLLVNCIPLVSTRIQIHSEKKRKHKLTLYVFPAIWIFSFCAESRKYSALNKAKHTDSAAVRHNSCTRIMTQWRSHTKPNFFVLDANRPAACNLLWHFNPKSRGLVSSIVPCRSWTAVTVNRTVTANE